LCENYRYQDNGRLHNLVQLGTLEELHDQRKRELLKDRFACLIKQNWTGQSDTFGTEDEVVEQLAQKYFSSILKKEKVDFIKELDYNTIDTDAIENKDIREVGTKWLCAPAVYQLQVRECLTRLGWDETQIQLAPSHIISHATYSALELRTSHWITENSAVCELTN